MLSTYTLNSEQTEISNLARDFARREISPKISACEHEDITKCDLPEKFYESGLINGRIPQKLGGLGLSLFDTALIAEQLAYACSGIAGFVEGSEIAITYLLNYASDEQGKLYLSKLAKDGGVAGIALDRDYKGHETLIVEDRADGFVLNGNSPFVLNAQMADWFIVSCAQGVFVVPSGAAGLRFLRIDNLLGRKAACVYKVDFDNVKLAASSLLKMDYAQYENIWAQNAGIIAAGCVGLAQSGFDQAKTYAKQRKTFGVPIADHQAIAFMLADINLDIEAARLMLYQLIASADDGKYSAKLGKSTLAFALDMVGRITIDCVQIYGGYGYSKEYPVEKLMRDAKTYQCFYPSTIDLKEQLGQAAFKE